MQTSKQLGSKWCVQVSMMISLRLLPLRRGPGWGGRRKKGRDYFFIIASLGICRGLVPAPLPSIADTQIHGCVNPRILASADTASAHTASANMERGAHLVLGHMGH